MKNHFYKLPFSLVGIMQKKDHRTCSLEQSIAQHLHLIITTAYGELSMDEQFGCCIWEYDFDNITSSHKIKEFIRESLSNAILRYEKRLGNTRVELEIGQEEMASQKNGCRVKKKITITITGWLNATNEKFIYEDAIFTGPLSYQLI
ncbi:GPW/gp25 family protein [Cyclobacterium plantarum]|uniref:GPW/gp25 family protein n=1 Tax=Cyclobacterium plantarum TaxID=2716263 RepID=A0ABX0HEP5_9BACT|nr:GPW/gp25 family protein [Cyclobacterium plantarum]NHE58475.1 GPW/gp25 family protein [Cyclobacterium plantarum]